MIYKAVTYSVIGIDDILDPANPFRRIAFLPEGADPAESLKHHYQTSNVLIHATVDATDPTLANRFWYVHYAEYSPSSIGVMATAQILLILKQGRTVLVISGPFKTEKEAQYDMELHWESGE